MSVLLIRANRNDRDKEVLASRGFDVIVEPYLQIAQIDNPEGAARLLNALKSEADWLVVTSVNALHYWSNQVEENSIAATIGARPELRIAAIGDTTATAVRNLGAREVVTPDEGTSRVLADVLGEYRPGIIVLPSGSISMRSIPDTLTPRGFTVLEETFYRIDVVDEPPSTADSLTGHGVDVVVFRSPSAVRAFKHFHQSIPEPVLLVASGPTTAAEILEAGWQTDATATNSSAEALADAVARAVEKA